MSTYITSAQTIGGPSNPTRPSASPITQAPTSTLGFYGKSGTGKSHNLLQVLRGLSRLTRQLETSIGKLTTRLSAIEYRGTYNSTLVDTHPRDLLKTSLDDNRLVPDCKSRDGMIPGLWGSKVATWNTDTELNTIVDRIDKRRTTSRTVHNPRSSRKHVIYLLVSHCLYKRHRLPLDLIFSLSQRWTLQHFYHLA